MKKDKKKIGQKENNIIPFKKPVVHPPLSTPREACLPGQGGVNQEFWSAASNFSVSVQFPGFTWMLPSITQHLSFVQWQACT